MRESQKVLSLRGRATDLMYTKLPGILKAAKTFPNLHPMNEICVLNPPFFCVKHVLGGV